MSVKLWAENKRRAAQAKIRAGMLLAMCMGITGLSFDELMEGWMV